MYNCIKLLGREEIKAAKDSKEWKAEATTQGEHSSVCKLKPIGFFEAAAAWLDLASQVMSTVALIFFFFRCVIVGFFPYFGAFSLLLLKEKEDEGRVDIDLFFHILLLQRHSFFVFCCCL